MVIIGAKGFAKELLTVLQWNNEIKNLFFFDNINKDISDLLFNEFPVIKSFEKLEKHFKNNSPDFALGIGKAKIRKDLSYKIQKIGGRLCSIISKQSLIGQYGNTFCKGINILSNATITSDVFVGEGTLINKSVILSHDVKMGSYCEISPGVKILGNCKIGNECEIGTNAVILPNIEVGNGCIIGAGAVVTKNIPDGIIVTGIPAKKMR